MVTNNYSTKDTIIIIFFPFKVFLKNLILIKKFFCNFISYKIILDFFGVKIQSIQPYFLFITDYCFIYFGIQKLFYCHYLIILSYFALARIYSIVFPEWNMALKLSLKYGVKCIISTAKYLKITTEKALMLHNLLISFY